MEEYSAKDKDEILFEVVKSHPQFCIINDNIKHEIARNYLIPDGYIKIIVEYDQGNMISYEATQKGINFVTNGGYVNTKKTRRRKKVYEILNKRITEIITGILVTLIATLILFCVFGIKSV